MFENQKLSNNFAKLYQVHYLDYTKFKIVMAFLLSFFVDAQMPQIYLLQHYEHLYYTESFVHSMHSSTHSIKMDNIISLFILFSCNLHYMLWHFIVMGAACAKRKI